MADMTLSPLFNSGRLLSLKVKTEKNTLEFRDSALLITMPLKSFNKELGLGMNMDKEVQEYEFMSQAILDAYIDNGGMFASINKLIKAKSLTRQIYNVTDADWATYIAKHGDDDYVTRYIKYCE
jgi:hypothetical protein